MAAGPPSKELKLAAAGGPVPGVTVELVGNPSANLQCSVEASVSRCFVPGMRGTYQLRVAAPGFQPLTLSVIVPGTEAPPRGCPTVQVQEVDVVLTPG